MSTIYTINPSKVMFDTKIAGFNETKDQASYDSLKLQIEEYGQTEPILMRNGLCCDGRHRCQIASDLNIDVKAIDVRPDMPDNEIIVLSNSNIFGGRNNSATQLAIKAHMLVEQFGMSDIKAVTLTGLKDKKAIGYVRRIKSSKLDKKYSIIDKLLQGTIVVIGDKKSRSLEVIKREVIKIEEEEFMKNKVQIETPQIDFNSILETELARDKFWLIQQGMTMEAKLHLVGILNALYIIDTVKYQDNITDEEIKLINKTNTTLDDSSKQVQQLVKNHLVENLVDIEIKESK